MNRRPPRAIVVSIGRTPDPWWWPYLQRDRLPCQLEYSVLVLDRGRPRGVLSAGFADLFARTTRTLARAHRERFDYLFTFENDWASFIIAAWQRLYVFRRPRHVILQFIMREREPSLRSRVKYAVMRWCFASVYLCICSATEEARYYAATFGWPGRFCYVPFHTDPVFLEPTPMEVEDFVLAAGRTFRDYDTLIEAAALSGLPVTIVAGEASRRPLPANVTWRVEISPHELAGLTARALIVALPLEDRQISIGQSVLLQAMAMGKPVVATRVAGTVDYVRHMETGVLVPPRDPRALADALAHLAGDATLRARLAAAARAQVERNHLPDHYAHGVSSVLGGALA